MLVCAPNRYSASRPIFEDAIGYRPDPGVEASFADRVDEENGVIRGVKILGVYSRNTARTLGGTYDEFHEHLDEPYCYGLDALREAAPLFEGVKVLLNHPEFSYSRTGARSASPTDREAEDVFGRIVNIRVTDEGLFGDHQFVKSHPFAAQFVEIAKRMPNVLAYSPAANGELRLVGTKPTIVKITDVRSVDLVGERPGTTSSLFESESRTMADENANKENPDLGAAPDLHEDDAPPMTAGAADATAPVAEDAADGYPTSPAQDHFDAAFEKEVMDIWAGDGSPQEKAGKIAKLAKQQEAIAGIRGKQNAEADEDEDEDLDLEESADPSAPADAAAKGQDGIAPKLAEAEACPPSTPKTDDASMHESAALKQRLTRVIKKYKTLEAEAERREAAIYESVDLLNSAGKPVRSVTLRGMVGIKDRKTRERFIAESLATRPTPAPKSQATSASRALHETTVQGQPAPGPGANSRVLEAITKGDAATLANMIRGHVPVA